MKKLSWGLLICLVALLILACGQKKVDRSQYAAIDPFDYKLNERKAEDGSVRKFKSVVQFWFKNEKGFTFYSLDRGTTLDVAVTDQRITTPEANQIATIYYTATKKRLDTLVLDDIDYTNTTEEGIGLVKSDLAPPAIDRASYRDIEPFDYKIEAENADQGEVRKYKSTVLFSAQNGTTFYFVSQEDDDAEGTLLTVRANQRFPSLMMGQEVTVYYTAKKGIVDLLSLDDIEL
jgi:cold shock CspA family protein